MIKKIVLGIVLTTICAALVYGAVTRTELRATAGIAENRNNSEGESNYRQGPNAGAGNNNSSNPDSGNIGTGSGNGFGKKLSNDKGTKRQNATLPEKGQSGPGLENVDEIYQLEGFTREVNADYLLVETTDAEQIIVENRAWWVAADAGFSTEMGDGIKIIGFYDGNGIFEAISIENMTQGTMVSIREENGRPFWAGGGNGKQ
jgi:hypothetical protein